MDSDGTHDPSEMLKLIYFAEFYDLVSASRFCSGGRMSSRKHYLFSFSYNILLRLILRTQIQDNLGGYYIAKKKMLMSLPLEIIFQGYGEYYFRLLYLVKDYGYSILEIPSNYRSRYSGESKSFWPKMILNYTLNAMKFIIYKQKLKK